MKKILMIAFHYPPVGGSGHLRTLKFSKYLPDFQWKPYILTVRDNVYRTKDPSLEREIPEQVQVVRTFSFDTRKVFSFKGKYFNFIATPDGYTSWLPSAVVEGLKIIREEGIDVLYSTSPVPTAHLIGLILKKMMKLPWVADFRDPWIEPTSEQDRSWFCLGLDRYLEGIVIKNADKVIATTELLKEEITERYPQLRKEKFMVISNGFDEEDFCSIALPKREHPERFELVHAGLVNGSYRSPKSLILAIKLFLEETGVQKENVLLKFLGGGSYFDSVEFKNMLCSLRLADVIHLGGYVPYADCLRTLFVSDVLVLLQGGEDTRSLIPAKAFEYLRVGRPILALTLDGATSNLMRNTGAGVVVDPDDVLSIKDALVKLFRAFKKQQTETPVAPSLIQQYSRRELARRLAQLLDLYSTRD